MHVREALATLVFYRVAESNKMSLAFSNRK